MLGTVIDTVKILVAALMATFLILIAVNIALFLKLRSTIPQEPLETPDT